MWKQELNTVAMCGCHEKLFSVLRAAVVHVQIKLKLHSIIVTFSYTSAWQKLLLIQSAFTNKYIYWNDIEKPFETWN